MTLRQAIEALVFASPKPLTAKEIVAALKSATEFSDEEPVLALAKTKADQIEEILHELAKEYARDERGFTLLEKASGWQVVSHEGCAVWVRQLYPENKPARLSPPALETLAIIAYRQPITRADIEAVRGVSVDGVMNTLLDRGLVKIAGRAEVPGRPLLYESTHFFLEHFGLKDLDELPNASELRQIKLPAAAAPETPEQPVLPLDPPAAEEPPPEGPSEPDATPELPPAPDEDSEPAEEPAK